MDRRTQPFAVFAGRNATLQDYDIGDEIGSGAFGDVFSAVHKERPTIPVAIKKLKKKRLIKHHQERYAVMELEAMKIVSDLPYCVQLLDYFDDTECIYLVMELVAGGALFDHIRGYGVPVDWAQFYLAELYGAITAVHDRGIIHRDLKPENILISDKGHLRVIDFGVSAEVKGTEALITFCGTADYVSPECLHNRPYRASVDWWAFGCLAPCTLVLDSTGRPVQAGQLSIGDRLLGPDARPREIVRLQVGDDAPMFKITTSRANPDDVAIDTDVVEVIEDHVLTLVFRKFASWQPDPTQGYEEHYVERGANGVHLRRRTVPGAPDPAVHGSLDRCYGTVDMSVRDFRSLSGTDQARFSIAVNRAPLLGPAVVTVDLPEVDTLPAVTIELTPGMAYLIGFWLGHGSISPPNHFTLHHTGLHGPNPDDVLIHSTALHRFSQLLEYWRGDSGLQALFGDLSEPELNDVCVEFSFTTNHLWARLLAVLGALLSDGPAAFSSKALPETLARALGNHENRLSFVAGFVDVNGDIDTTDAKFPTLQLSTHLRDLRDGLRSLAVLLGLDTTKDMKHVTFTNNPRVITDILRRSVFRKGLMYDPASQRTGVVEDTHFRAPLSPEDDAQCTTIPCPVPGEHLPFEGLPFAGRRFMIEPTDTTGRWIGIGLPDDTDKRHVLADGSVHHNCIAYELLVGKSPFNARSVHLTYQKILTRQLTLPEEMDRAGRDLVDKLLLSDPEDRLDPAAIRSHAFFDGVDWDGLASMKPPIMPGVQISSPEIPKAASPHTLAKQSAMRWSVRDSLLRTPGMALSASHDALYPDLGRLPDLPLADDVAGAFSMSIGKRLGSEVPPDHIITPPFPVTLFQSSGDYILLAAPFITTVYQRNELRMFTNSLIPQTPSPSDEAPLILNDTTFDCVNTLPCTSAPYFALGIDAPHAPASFLFPSHRRIASIVTMWDEPRSTAPVEWAAHSRSISCADVVDDIIVVADVGGAISLGRFDPTRPTPPTPAFASLTPALHTVQTLAIGPAGDAALVSDGSGVVLVNLDGGVTPSLLFETGEASLAAINWIDASTACVVGSHINMIDIRAAEIPVTGDLGAPATHVTHHKASGRLAIGTDSFVSVFDIRSMAKPLTTILTGYQQAGAVTAFDSAGSTLACSTVYGTCVTDVGGEGGRRFLEADEPVTALAFHEDSLFQAFSGGSVSVFEMG